MKGKLGIVLSICLLTSQVAFAGAPAKENPLALTGSILFGAAPDDLRPPTMIPAALGLVIGGALVAFQEQITGAPVVGAVLKQLTLGQVAPADVVEGLGIFTAVNGVLGLWQNGPSLRANYASSVGLLLAKEQFAHPGVVGEHEVRNALVAGLAVMQGIPFLQNTLPGLIGKLPSSNEAA